METYDKTSNQILHWPTWWYDGKVTSEIGFICISTKPLSRNKFACKVELWMWRNMPLNKKAFQEMRPVYHAFACQEQCVWGLAKPAYSAGHGKWKIMPCMALIPNDACRIGSKAWINNNIHRIMEWNLGMILGLHPANEIRRHKVTPSPMGWAQT